MADLLINIKVQGGKEASSALDSIQAAAKKATSSIGSFQEQAKKTQGVTNKSVQEAVKLSNKLNELALSEKAVAKGINELNKGLISSTQFTNRYGKAVSNLKAEIRNSYGANLQYEKSINQVNEALKKSSISTNKFSGILKTVKAAAIGYATVLATMELQQFVSGTISAGIAIDSLRRSFVAITGDAESAAQQIKFLRGTADELGLTYTSLEKSYKDILAASKGTSLEGQGVEKIFIAISKASAVLGMSVDETQGSLRALSQMISKGNVQAEELRGQLGERLPGAFQKAARAMGVTTQKLNDMLENGEVLAEDLIPKLADVLEDDFARAAVNASQRAQASFNKLSNSVQKFQETIGEAGLTNFFANLANVSADALNSLNKLLGDEEPTDRLKRRISEAETVLAELRGEVESNQLDIWGKYKSAIEAAAKASGDFVELDLEDMTQAQIENRLEVDKLTLSYLELEKVIKKFPSRTSISEQIGDSENRAKEIIAIRKELSVLSSDDTNQQMEKSIAAAEKTKNELIARAKNSATVRKEIEDWFQKEKIKIEQDAAKKRQDIVDKENKAIEKENNERLKNEKKLLQQLFDEYDIATKVLNNRKKFNKELSKLQKSAFDYQKDLIEEEKKEWIAKGISAIDAEKSANKKLEKLYKERADAARSAALSIYGDTGTTNDNYWSLRADDIDAYIEKLHDMGVSEAAITAASKKKWQEYNDDKAKADDDFLASIKAGLHEYQKEYETLGEHLSDIAHTAASGMESAFSDTLFDALKGDIDDISRVWESFMDDMLRSLTDTVADMAIQWGIGAIGTATGWWDSGAWEVKKDHVAVVHAGEMIVPADVASIIRSGKPTDESQIDELAKVSPSGGHEWSSSDKAMLTGMMNNPSAQNMQDTAEMSAIDKQAVSAATKAATKSMAMMAAQGISLSAQGAISVGDLAKGLIGPGIGQAAMSGVTGYVKESLGLNTSAFGTVGGLLGSLTGAFTGTGLVGATLGDLAGSYVGMALGDCFNARNEEETRDLLEDAYGWVSGQRAYASIDADARKAVADAISNASWGNASTFGTTDFGGFTGFDADIGFSNTGMFSLDSFGVDFSGAFSGGDSSNSTSGNSSDGPGNGNDSGTNGASSDGNGNDGSGYATGGVIDSLMVPYGEDGWAAVQFGEGVISKEGMEALEKLNEGNLKDFYPTYDSNLENIISITNSIQKAVYEALGRDIPTTLTLQDAGIVLESDNMTKVTELFDSIREGGIEAEELETAYQSFIGVGLSAADASSATQELITAYTEQETLAESLAGSIESFNDNLNDIINKNTLSDYEYDLLKLSEWYEEQITLANELGTSIELVNKAYNVQAQIIEDALLDKITSFNDSIQDIIDENTLSDYALSLKAFRSLNEWYEEQVKTAEELGVSLESLDEAYILQLKSINEDHADQVFSEKEAELSQAVAEAEKALSTARSNYISVLDREIDKYQEVYDSISEEIDIKEDLISENENLKDSFEDLKDSLVDFQNDLVISNGVTDPQQRIAASKILLDETVSKLYSSDQEEVQQALKDLPSVSKDYLNLSQELNLNQIDQNKTMGYVQKILNESQDIASDQSDKVEETLYGINLQNTILIENRSYYESQIALLSAIRNKISNNNNLLNLNLSQAQSNYEKALDDANSAQKEYDEYTSGDSSNSPDDSIRSSYELLVKQTYRDVLGREGLPAGIDYWVNSLIDESDSVNLSNFREAFINGAVAAGELKGETTNNYEDIVEQMYWDILGRAGLPAGIDYWVNSLEDPTDSVDLSNFRQAFINAAVAAGEIPAFADGGSVYGPTFALLGEGGEVEHITPDSQMKEVKELLSKIYEVLYTSMNLSGTQKDNIEDLLDIMERNVQGILPFETTTA